MDEVIHLRSGEPALSEAEGDLAFRANSHYRFGLDDGGGLDRAGAELSRGIDGALIRGADILGPESIRGLDTLRGLVC